MFEKVNWALPAATDLDKNVMSIIDAFLKRLTIRVTIHTRESVFSRSAGGELLTAGEESVTLSQNYTSCYESISGRLECLSSASPHLSERERSFLTSSSLSSS